MPITSPCGLVKSQRKTTQGKGVKFSEKLADSSCSIINLGSAHRYVMESLLAFSAMHIAFLTDCPIVGNMAYEHRGRALGGLHEAISSFSYETSDAVLAASLVLSWQATDWYALMNAHRRMTSIHAVSLTYEGIGEAGRS